MKTILNIKKYFKRKETHLIFLFHYFSISLAIFSMFLLMLGIHSVDNSLNALIRYKDDWYYYCDVVEYKLDDSGNFTGSCIPFPQLYILGLRITIISALLFFLSGVSLGFTTRILEEKLKKKQ